MKRIWSVLVNVIKVKDESWSSWAIWIAFLLFVALAQISLWHFIALVVLFRWYGHARKADGEKPIVVKEFERLNLTISGKEANRRSHNEKV